MRFFLFILVNAVLFVRPAELIPELDGAPIYEAAILACLAVSVPGLAEQLKARRLIQSPIAVCVLGLLAFVVLSLVAQGELADARAWGTRYVKIVLYYLLLLTAVDTPQRLRQFLGWIGVLILALTALVLMQYHGLIALSTFESIHQRERDAATGEVLTFPRLCGMGIFNDPNDLSLILVVGMMVCLARVTERTRTRWLWLAPIALMGYALVLTHSRGGFFAFIAALLALTLVRYGVLRSLLVGGAVLVVMVAAGGRQVNLDLTNKDDTGQQRIRLWRDGLVMLRASPAFGIGAGRYPEEMGLVAHNSFVEAFTELGLLGGCCFVGAFLYPLGVLYRLRARAGRLRQPVLQHLGPYVLACATALAVGMLSLSRGYSLTPYLVLGVVTVYLKLVAQTAPSASPTVSFRLIGQTLLLGVVVLGATHGFILLLGGTS